jgi:hypothetical protein
MNCTTDAARSTTNGISCVSDGPFADHCHPLVVEDDALAPAAGMDNLSLKTSVAIDTAWSRICQVPNRLYENGAFLGPELTGLGILEFHGPCTALIIPGG